MKMEVDERKREKKKEFIRYTANIMEMKENEK